MKGVRAAMYIRTGLKVEFMINLEQTHLKRIGRSHNLSDVEASIGFLSAEGICFVHILFVLALPC